MIGATKPSKRKYKNVKPKEVTLGLGMPVIWKNKVYEIVQKNGVTHLADTTNDSLAYRTLIPLSYIDQSELKSSLGKKVSIPYTF